MRKLFTLIMLLIGFYSIYAQNEPQVYIVGRDEGNAVYWLNNQKFILPRNNTEANANAITYSGSDIYIAGSEFALNSTGSAINREAVYWLNGRRFVLPKVGSNADASAIALLGSDVYITGSEYALNNSGNPINSDAIYWLNGRRFVLPKVSTNANANAIAISGTNVFITGTDGNDAVYWLNGRRNVLPKTGNNAIAVSDSIFISDTNIFIGGNIWVNTRRYAVYWVNNNLVVLSGTDTDIDLMRYSGSSIPDFSIRSIAISGTNIYFAGGLWAHNSGNAVYWLNNRWFWLSSESFISSARGISIFGSDVYIVGNTNDPIGTRNSGISDRYNSNAVYWLNGKQFVLSNSGRGSANAIVIK